MLQNFPSTSNQCLDLNTPKKLTLAEFEALPVSEVHKIQRKAIYEVEEFMFSLPGCYDDDQMEILGIKPIHRFVNGLYHRELTIPPNNVVVGKRHGVEHIVMLIAGECLCFTERGVEYMKAPMTFISPAGEKRIVATQDKSCTWVTLHPTTKTDLDEIEDEVIIDEPLRMAKYRELQAQKKELL